MREKEPQENPPEERFPPVPPGRWTAQRWIHPLAIAAMASLAGIFAYITIEVSLTSPEIAPIAALATAGFLTGTAIFTIETAMGIKTLQNSLDRANQEIARLKGNKHNE